MTRIASHRGGTLEFGDSTPAGFLASSRMPLEEVEFDVHPTRDGRIVVHHDATLDRTTDRAGAIAALTWDEVSRARIQGGEGGHPIQLVSLCSLYAFSPVAFRCEIKPAADGRPYEDFVPAVIDALGSCRRLASTVFSSFSIDTVDEIGRHCDQPRLWLVNPGLVSDAGIAAVIATARDHGVPELGLHIDQCSVDVRNAVVSSGLAFGCWAAHSTKQIDRALELGAKVFTTDRPTLAIARRERFHARA